MEALRDRKQWYVFASIMKVKYLVTYACKHDTFFIKNIWELQLHWEEISMKTLYLLSLYVNQLQKRGVSINSVNYNWI